MSGQVSKVETLSLACSECGLTQQRLCHTEDSCGGLLVDIGGTIRCVDCGTKIPRSVSCPNCGTQTTFRGTSAVVSLRPQFDVGEFEDILIGRLSDGYTDRLDRDATLSAIAREYAAADAETKYFSTGRETADLADQISDHSITPGSYQTVTIDIRATGETPAEIAEHVYTEALTDFPADEHEFTHVGAGARWNPQGGVHVACVAAIQHASFPDDMQPGRLEKAIHRVTDERRIEHGRDHLAYEEHLACIARGHSRSMALQGFVDHFAPDGSDAADRYERAGYTARQVGENLAKKYVPAGIDVETLAEEVVNDWMNSPDHREVLLERDYERVGIGVYQANDGAILFTQNFS